MKIPGLIGAHCGWCHGHVWVWQNGVRHFGLTFHPRCWLAVLHMQDQAEEWIGI